MEEEVVDGQIDRQPGFSTEDPLLVEVERQLEQQPERKKEIRELFTTSLTAKKIKLLRFVERISSRSYNIY